MELIKLHPPSNHLRGAFSSDHDTRKYRYHKVCIWRAECRALARATTNTHRGSTPCTFAPPHQQRLSAHPGSARTLALSCGTCWFHGARVTCGVRADPLRIEMQASGTSLTQRSSSVDVLEQQEAAEAACCDVESVPRAARPVVLHGSPVMLMAGLEHVSC